MSGLTQTAVLSHWISAYTLVATDWDCPVTEDSCFRSHIRAILSHWTGECTEAGK